MDRNPGKLKELLGVIVGGTWDRSAYQEYEQRIEPLRQLLRGDDPMQAVALIDAFRRFVAAAEKAVGLAPENFMVLDTLAHLQAAQGDIEKAIATQKKAVEHAAGSQLAPQVRGYLESLQAKAKP